MGLFLLEPLTHIFSVILECDNRIHTPEYKCKTPQKGEKKIQSADFSAVLTAIFVYLHFYDTKIVKLSQIANFSCFKYIIFGKYFTIDESEAIS